MPRKSPLKFINTLDEKGNIKGVDYGCEGCGDKIPDGCKVLVWYGENDEIVGIQVVDFDGNVRHKCGKHPTKEPN